MGQKRDKQACRFSHSESRIQHVMMPSETSRGGGLVKDCRRARVHTHTHTTFIAASYVYSLKVKHLLLTDYIWQAYCMCLTLKYQCFPKAQQTQTHFLPSVILLFECGISPVDFFES